MAVAVVERFKQEPMYTVWNVCRDKKWPLYRGDHWGEVAVSGGSTVFTVLGLSPVETKSTS